MAIWNFGRREFIILAMILFEHTYFLFNFFEGSFWIFLSCLCWYFGFKKSNDFRGVAIFTAIILFIFGVSDFVEIKTDGFIDHTEWLFVWKGFCVAGLIFSTLWYFFISSKKYHLLPSKVFIVLATLLFLILTFFFLIIFFPDVQNSFYTSLGLI